MTAILVGIDGSPASVRAARYASGLSALTGDAPILAFVNPPLQPLNPDVIIPDAWSDELRKQASALLKEAADSCSWPTPPQLLLADGPVAESLVGLGRIHDAGMIVVCRTGHGSLAGALLGSVADRLVHISDRPVLVLPFAPDRGPDPEHKLRMARIVVGVDGSDESRRALAMATRLSQRTGAKLILAHAIAPPVEAARVLPGYTWWEDAAQAAANKFIAAEATRLERPCETVAQVDRPSTLLCTLGEIHDADLIVVGHRGRGAVEQLLLGSTTAEVLRGTRRPVLVVR